MSPINALETVFARNQFYRRQYFLALGAFVLSWLLIGVLISEVIYLKDREAVPVYFATDKVGRLIKVVPETVPNMTQQEIKDWIVEAVEAAYSYDYVNFRAQMQHAQKYFDPFGWTEYMKGLTLSNNLLALNQRKMIVIAQVVDEPKLVAEGMMGNATAWKYDMNVLVSYWEPPYEEQPNFQNALMVSVKLKREPVLQSYKGLGIVQLVARNAGT